MDFDRLSSRCRFRCSTRHHYLLLKYNTCRFCHALFVSQRTFFFCTRGHIFEYCIMCNLLHDNGTYLCYTIILFIQYYFNLPQGYPSSPTPVRSVHVRPCVTISRHLQLQLALQLLLQLWMNRWTRNISTPRKTKTKLEMIITRKLKIIVNQ